MILGCGLLLALAFGAFCTLFSTWASYDDEGYILWTLIHHAQGHRLYDDIFTQYGPAFYLLDAGFRRLLPLAYSSDGQRWQTWIFWLVTTGLMLYVSQHAARQSRGKVLDRWNFSTILFAFLLLWHQDRLALEPGHPQIWCNLLVCTSLCLFAASPAWPRSRTASFSMLLHGLLAGTLLMIKPNVGILLLAALPAASLWRLPSTSRWWLAIDSLYTLPLLMLPWMLTHRQLHTWNAACLPSLVSVSILALRLSVANTSRPGTFHPASSPGQVLAPLAWLAGGSLLTMIAFTAWGFQQGIGLATLCHALFGQHASLLELYFYPAIRSEIGYATLLLLLALLGYHLVLPGSRGRKTTPPTPAGRLGREACPSRIIAWGSSLAPSRAEWSLLFLTLVSSCLLITFLDSLVPLTHGLQPRGCAELLCVASPLIVAGWWNFRTEPRTVTGLSREIGSNLPFASTASQSVPPEADTNKPSLIALGMIAALQPLIAFPVPGTQLALGTLPLLALLIDGSLLAWQTVDLARPWHAVRSHVEQRPKLASLIVLLLPCLAFTAQAFRFFQYAPLDLPGARLLRIPNDQADATRDIVAAIQHYQPTTFVFRWHNRPSWYLWSQIPPPYHQLPPSWVYLLPYDRKLQQLESLRELDRVLVIDEAYTPQKPPPPSPWNESWLSELSPPPLPGEFQLRGWSAPPSRRTLDASL
jgi:hypothetical protein